MGMSPYVKRLREVVGHDLLQMPCVAAIIKQNGGILMQRRADDGKWGLPGGAIDPGEAPAQALIREVYEEVGLEVRPVSLLGVFGAFPNFHRFYPNGDEVHALVMMFECAAVGGELLCRDGEATELRYFSPEEVSNVKPEYRAILSDKPSEAYFEWSDEWLKKI